MCFDVFLLFFFFFYILFVGYGFLDGTFFWYNDRFEATFDVKGHLEWGLRYRRCDRVSGCCSGWPYFLRVERFMKRYRIDRNVVMEMNLIDDMIWYMVTNVPIFTTDACNYDNRKRNSFELISNSYELV